MDAAELEPSQELMNELQQDSGRSEKVNILLVDDHVENLIALEAILDGPGHNLIRATSGREALRCLLHEDYAVILLDVQMPGMDGFETAALIRERDKLKHTPIIFLTALNRGDSNVYRGYSLGAVDYIFKPFEAEVLRAKVNVFVELFRKTEEVRHQAELLRHANQELGRNNKAIGGLYQELERKSIELYKERDFISAVLETAGSPVVVFDPEGKIERVNKALEQISGYNRQELEGKKPWENLVDEEDVPKAINAIERVRKGEYPLQQENCWVTKSGDIRRIVFTYAALLNEDGSTAHIIGTGVDITERHHAEEEVKKLNEELEQRVLTRTAQLQSANRDLEIEVNERKRAEEELKRAKEVAEMANSAKDQFLAVLSHELRTPLTPVLTIIQMLEEEPDLDDDLRTWVQTIRRNVELEARLIDDLLDLTRIANGKLQLNIDVVDVHSLLDNVIEICKEDIKRKNIHLEVERTAINTVMKGDPARLQQVFWNLLKNAVKFTPERGKITIRTSTLANGEFKFDVIDSGIGMSKQLLPKVFDAFEQGDKKITRQFGGLGLGLAISRALIDAHNGKIQAYSAGKNKGATFSVILPTVDAVDNTGAVELREKIVSSNGQSNTKILIVEDNPDTGDVLQNLLERKGYHVKVAHSVQEAVRLAGQFHYEIVISDIGLPDGTGHELLEKLSAIRPSRSIAMSGYGMERDIQKSLTAGFSAHFVKPIDFDQLHATIVQLVHLPEAVNAV